jgi:small nuclear ribonucleoprotein F
VHSHWIWRLQGDPQQIASDGQTCFKTEHVGGMSSTSTPGAFMQGLIGKRVVVKSKWGAQYAARLVSTDSYMNLLLSECHEHTEGSDEEPVIMNEVLLRCNNVLYVREIPDGEEVRFS